MKNHFTREFMYDTIERAIKTAAQAAIGVLGTGAVGLLTVDWVNVLSVTAMAALISVLTSIASVGATDTLTPASVVPSITREGKHVASVTTGEEE
ncbi:holin [Alloscardovia omnicolens]|uniref:holin n=1 Tax=Alloscardovia omnicolens TaxID=419015 RepID=UPI0006664134|nr:holin [Alloscardovia omnicolens]